MTGRATMAMTAACMALATLVAPAGAAPAVPELAAAPAGAPTAPGATAKPVPTAGPDPVEPVAAPTVTVTVRELRAEPEELFEEESCWYRSGLVTGPADVEFVHPDLHPLTADELAELGYGDSFKELPDLLDDVTVYAIPPDLDPLQAALNMGNGASPVLMAGYAYHWGYAPGAPPTDNVRINGRPLRPQSLFTGLAKSELLVGVIDTGFIDYPVTPWPTGRVQRPTQRDAEPAAIDPQLSGHGMFVASTILQRRPEASVSVARAGITPLAAFQPHPASARADFWNDHVHMSTEAATDELQMFLAVQRLLDQSDGTDTPFAALNISMGTYLCDQLASSGLAIRAALARWQDAQPSAPVVAAAGNHETHDPIPTADYLPADLDLTLDPLKLLPVVSRHTFDLTGLDLTAVAALDHSGKGLADYSNHKPHDVFAVGTDILGIRGATSVTAWSGTSFATPVVTGAIVGGELPKGDIYELGPVRQLP